MAVKIHNYDGETGNLMCGNKSPIIQLDDNLYLVDPQDVFRKMDEEITKVSSTYKIIRVNENAKTADAIWNTDEGTLEKLAEIYQEKFKPFE